MPKRKLDDSLYLEDGEPDKLPVRKDGMILTRHKKSTDRSAELADASAKLRDSHETTTKLRAAEQKYRRTGRVTSTAILEAPGVLGGLALADSTLLKDMFPVQSPSNLTDDFELEAGLEATGPPLRQCETETSDQLNLCQHFQQAL
ncbi:hypothetical protein K505DRAFT_367678 [Melanomma pulvis-pyrius CBS 109.77]|uniref:Uncharacterized protein n=1 Tax=Melanomma pulvis-pyrius CBS 109.77 TaxID=1314802 RepID=A0A6A6WT13_9PLEO|nr:hypothetical protein K505DRAFT_367678 [Melanomma pulvis-pyrius CBS 109.77]